MTEPGIPIELVRRLRDANADLLVARAEYERAVGYHGTEQEHSAALDHLGAALEELDAADFAVAEYREATR